jgi:hypothetical protein
LRLCGLNTSGALRASHVRQPEQGPDCAPFHYERRRLAQTTLYRQVQQHAATFFAQAEVEACADQSV